MDEDVVFVLDMASNFFKRPHVDFIVEAPTQIQWDEGEPHLLENLTMMDTKTQRTYAFGDLSLPSPCTAANLLRLVQDIVE